MSSDDFGVRSWTNSSLASSVASLSSARDDEEEEASTSSISNQEPVSFSSYSSYSSSNVTPSPSSSVRSFSATSETGEENRSEFRPGESRSGDDNGNLLMPSMIESVGPRMQLPLSDRNKNRLHIVVAGRSLEERRMLIGAISSEGDLSHSSHSSSSQHANGSTPTVIGIHCTDFEELASTQDISFWTPRSALSTPALAEHLLDPFLSLEKYLNPAVGSTEQLLSIASNHFGHTEGFTACLMLFSSPPSAAEITLARSIAPLIPILPVLILPPASSKVQKTTALRNAVDYQLVAAGIDYGVEEGTDSLYLLPHYLFEYDDNSSLRSFQSSLASSQELDPLAPRYHHQPSDDLSRLAHSLARHDKLRRSYGESFMSWREVEIAAKGVRAMEELPTEWKDTAVKMEFQSSLRFSQRVAERRSILMFQHRLLTPPSSPSLNFVILDPDAETDSSIVDPNTPRCQRQSLPASAATSSHPNEEITPSSNQPQLYHPSSSFINYSDPFHFPSLFQLCRLNLRLVLSSSLSSEHYRIVSFAFLAAVFSVGVTVRGA